VSLTPGTTNLLFPPDVSDLLFPGARVTVGIQRPKAIIVKGTEPDDQVFIEESSDDVDVDDLGGWNCLTMVPRERAGIGSRGLGTFPGLLHCILISLGPTGHFNDDYVKNLTSVFTVKQTSREVNYC
jgi:hypothetical protein